jgi:hypothetical protein
VGEQPGGKIVPGETGDGVYLSTFVRIEFIARCNPLPHSSRVKTLKEEHKSFYQPLLFIAC